MAMTASGTVQRKVDETRGAPLDTATLVVAWSSTASSVRLREPSRRSEMVALPVNQAGRSVKPNGAK
jgi:hypothetical protein